MAPAPGLGNRIKLVREQLGHTPPDGNQTTFARELRITQGTVSDWERGPERKGTTPSSGDLWLIAHLCEQAEKVHHWLMTGRDNPGIRRARRSV